MPRQRTLQATVNWSYEFCSTAEQLLRRRLAVFERMGADAANLEAALRFCLEQPGEEGRGLALGVPHCLSGPIGEVRRWVESALDQVQGSSSPRVTALWRASWLAAPQGDLDAARRLAGECHQLAVQTRDASAATYAAQFSAVVDLFDGRYERALQGLHGAIEQHECLGDTTGRYYAVAQLAMAQCFSGDPAGVQTAEWCRRHAHRNSVPVAGAGYRRWTCSCAVP